jgi:hypothetical protein
VRTSNPTMISIGLLYVVWKRGLGHQSSFFSRRRNNFWHLCSYVLNSVGIFHYITQ